MLYDNINMADKPTAYSSRIDGCLLPYRLEDRRPMATRVNQEKKRPMATRVRPSIMSDDIDSTDDVLSTAIQVLLFIATVIVVIGMALELL